MRELWLITKREYLARVKKKSFIILTILMPVLIVSLMCVPFFLSQIKDSKEQYIAIIDNTGLYTNTIQSTNNYIFYTPEDDIANLKQNIGDELFGILQINTDLSVDPSGIIFFSEKQIPEDLIYYINQTLSEAAKSKHLEDWITLNNIDKSVASSLQSEIEKPLSVNITTMRLDNDMERESSMLLASSVGGVLTFLMYLFILMYGTMVLNGVVEEKSSRIVEVLICTVRPFNLMMGKILGIGLTGITQLIVWAFIIILLFMGGTFFFGDSIPNMLNSTDISLDSLLLINWIEVTVFFILLFIGGYLLYASVFAMFGAAVDNAQDTQQFVMPVTILFMFAFYAAIYSLKNPDGPLAFWCSIIPFTSPIVMMVRIPFGIPLYDKLLSIGILYITIILMVKFAAKIYRVGILMYGKKPSVKEMISWLRYK